MTSNPEPQPSKPQQVAEEIGGGLLEEAFGAIVDIALQTANGAGDALTCAGQIAAACGSAAIDATCAAAGSLADGL